MALRYPNRVSQTGTYTTGTPDYVDVSAGSAQSGYRLFSDASTAWENSDRVGIGIVKSPSDWKVWIATWDSVNSYLELDTEEASEGTISNGDEVVVYADATALTIREATTTPEYGQFNAVTASRALTTNDAGKVICGTGAGSMTLTLDDGLPVGFHCIVVQEGDGIVSVDCEGSDTLNGVATGTGVSVAAKYKSLYIYQRTEGAWVALG